MRLFKWGGGKGRSEAGGGSIEHQVSSINPMPNREAVEDTQFKALANIGLAGEFKEKELISILGGRFFLETYVYSDTIDDRLSGIDPQMGRGRRRQAIRAFNTKGELLECAKQITAIHERWDRIMEHYSRGQTEGVKPAEGSAVRASERHKRRLLGWFIEGGFPKDGSPLMTMNYGELMDRAFGKARMQSLDSSGFERKIREEVAVVRSTNSLSKASQYEAAASEVLGEEAAFEDRRCSRVIFNAIMESEKIPKDGIENFENRVRVGVPLGGPQSERNLLNDLLGAAAGTGMTGPAIIDAVRSYTIFSGENPLTRTLIASVERRVEEYFQQVRQHPPRADASERPQSAGAEELEEGRFTIRDFDGIKTAARILRGKERSACQDYVVCMKFGDLQLLAVFDGMGGGRIGHIASSTAAGAVIDAVQKEAEGGPEEALRKALNSAHQKVFQLSQEPDDAIGTTVVAALINTRTGKGGIAWVGDSRIYKVSGGTAEALTIDDNIAGGGGLKKEDISIMFRNLLTQYIGLKTDEGGISEIDVHTKAVRLRKGEMLFLCTDGVYDYIEDQLPRILASGNPLAERLRTAFEKAQEARIKKKEDIDDQSGLIYRMG